MEECISREKSTQKCIKQMNYKDNFQKFIDDFKYLCDKYYEIENKKDIYIKKILPLREARTNIHEIMKKILDDNKIISNDWIHSNEYSNFISKLDDNSRKIFIKEMDSSTIKNHLWYMRNLKSSSPDIRAKAHAYTLIKNFESMFDTSSPNNEKRFIELKKTIDKFLGVKNGGSKRRLLKSY